MFKVAWASLIKIAKLTYTMIEVKKAIFRKTNLTKSDILFAKSDEYTILYLKQSIINLEHIGI